MVASPFYTRLRTEEQLGYVVFGTPLPLRKAPGMALVVQSPVANPVKLEDHIDRFLQEMQQNLVEMKPEQLDRYKQSLISRILKRENSLSERSNRYWAEIDRDGKDFNSREELAEAVASLDLNDLVNCYQGMSSRRLTVRSFGQKHLANVGLQEIAKKCDVEIDALKANNEFMPGA